MIFDANSLSLILCLPAPTDVLLNYYSETTEEELHFIALRGKNRLNYYFELIFSLSLIISNGYTKTMHQLILVHSHLLDQCDREGVSTCTLLFLCFHLTFCVGFNSSFARTEHSTSFGSDE